MKAGESTRVMEIEKRNRMLKGVLLSAALALTLLLITRTPLLLAFADAGTDAAMAAVDITLKILQMMMIIVGAFLFLLGISQFAMNHDSGDGPEQKKAIMKTATGITLIVLGFAVIMGLKDSMKTIIEKAVEAANS